MISIGINLSSNRISIAELSKSRKGIQIRKMIRDDLPGNPISRGEIINPLEVANGLKKIWKKYRLSGRKVYLGIANQKTIVKEINIPLVDDNEISSSIKYQISEYIPIPKDDIIYDYFIIEKSKSSSRLLLVGAMKSMVNSFIESIKLSGLIVQAVDLNAFALFRTLEYINKNKNKKIKNREGDIFLAINLGDEVTNVEILADDKMKYPRVTTVSLNSFIERLNPIIERDTIFCRELIDSYDFKSNLGTSSKKEGDASSKKKTGKEPIKDPTEKGIKDLIKDDRIISMFEAIAQDLINEINISIEHYNQESSGSKVKKIILSGNIIKNIDKYIEDKTGLKVDLLDLKSFKYEATQQKTGGQDKKENAGILDPIAIGMSLRGLN